MIDLGESHPDYVASSILTKKIRIFNEESKLLVPFLKANTTYNEVSTDQEIEKTLNVIYKIIEPCVINVRAGK
jgi:adenylate kinase family enzyme